jgi:hypothetical protein
MRHKDAGRGPTGDAQPCYTGQERRTSPRIQTPFPATVRSVEANDEPFEEQTILDNLSSCGLYLRLARRVRQGIRLFIRIRFSISPNADASVAWIELHGMVLRTEPRPGGIFGTAIRLTHQRFIYATAQPLARCAAFVMDPDSKLAND